MATPTFFAEDPTPLREMAQKILKESGNIITTCSKLDPNGVKPELGEAKEKTMLVHDTTTDVVNGLSQTDKLAPSQMFKERVSTGQQVKHEQLESDVSQSHGM